MAVTLLVTLLLSAGPASAQRPDDSAAVDQYVEDVPTSGGSEISGGGSSEPESTPLPPDAASALQAEGGEDAGVLERIATSSAYGAPKAKLEALGSEASGRPLRPEDEPSAGGGLSAAVSAVQGGEAGRLVGVLVALLVITALAVAGAALRQRRRGT